MRKITIPKLFRSTVIGNVLLFSLIAIITSLLFSVILRRIMIAEFEDKGAAITTGIATSSVELILNRDASTLQASIDQFIDPAGGVGYVFVVDNRDRIIAHTFVPGVPEVLLGFKDGVKDQIITREVSLPGRGDFLDVVAPVLFGEAGYVHVGMDTDVIAAQIRSGVLIQSGLLIVMFFIAILVTISQDNRIARPIVRLAEYAAEVAANPVALASNQMSDELRPVAERDDELGQLVSSFQHMTQEVYERERRLERRSLAIETSAEVSRRLSTILDEQELVKAVVEQVQAAFDYYHVHIYLLNDKTGALHMAGGTGEAGQTMLAQGHQIPMGKGLVGRSAQTNTAVLVPDVSEDANWLANPLLPETKAETAVPIAIGDEVLGVLDVQHNIVDGLDQSDVDLLQSMTSQIAVALRNARDYAMTQQRAEQEVRLNAINHKIDTAQSVEEVMQIAVRELGQVLGAEKTAIRLLENGRRETVTQS